MMTVGTRQDLKELFTAVGQRARGPAAQPLLVFAGFHHVNPADHGRVLSAAILCAEQMILTRLSRLEPGGGISTRQHISFSAEGRNEKAVNYIFGGHRELDRL